MKFVILTDTHFVPRGRKLYGLDPAERLAVAVEKINATHKDISFVIVTGDLAHWGEQAAYCQPRRRARRAQCSHHPDDGKPRQARGVPR